MCMTHFPVMSLWSSSMSSEAIPRQGRMGSGQKLYWAKGTGFGTGSTTSTWNVNAMRAKQKAEERHVCLCFAILCEYLSVPKGCGQEVESWCGPTLAELLANSCLLPAITSYLVNDSSKIVAAFCLSLIYSLTHLQLWTSLSTPTSTRQLWDSCTPSPPTLPSSPSSHSPSSLTEISPPEETVSLSSLSPGR